MPTNPKELSPTKKRSQELPRPCLVDKRFKREHEHSLPDSDAPRAAYVVEMHKSTQGKSSSITSMDSSRSDISSQYSTTVTSQGCYPIPKCLHMVMESARAKKTQYNIIPPDHFMNVLLRTRGYKGCPDRSLLPGFAAAVPINMIAAHQIAEKSTPRDKDTQALKNQHQEEHSLGAVAAAGGDADEFDDDVSSGDEYTDDGSDTSSICSSSYGTTDSCSSSSFIDTTAPPDPELVKDYTLQLLLAVETSNVDVLRNACKSGKSMAACNKHGESLLHKACRIGSSESVRFLLSHGANLNITDDQGRCPAHDVCWRAEPDFDIVLQLLELQPQLLFKADKRGFTPLMYIRRDQWLDWCCFLYHHRNNFWPVKK